MGDAVGAADGDVLGAAVEGDELGAALGDAPGAAVGRTGGADLRGAPRAVPGDASTPTPVTSSHTLAT